MQAEASQPEGSDASVPRRAAEKICTSFSLGTLARCPPCDTLRTAGWPCFAHPKAKQVAS
jgi:hypothetical protein